MKPLNDAWAQLRARPQVLVAAAVLLVLTAGVLAWGMTQGSAASDETAIAQAPTTTSSAEGAATTAETSPPDASVDAGRSDPFTGGPSGSGSGGAAADGTAATGTSAGSSSGASSSGASPSSGSSGASTASGSSGSSGSSSSGSASSGSSSSGSGSSSSGSSSSGSGSSGSSSSGSSGSSSSSSSKGSGSSSKSTTTRSSSTPPLRFSAQVTWPGARRQVRGIALGSAQPSTKRPLFRIDSVNLEKKTVRIALQRRARLAEGSSETLRCVQRDRGRCSIVQLPFGRTVVVAWAVRPEDTYQEYSMAVMTAYRGSSVVARARTSAEVPASELVDPVTSTTEAAAAAAATTP